MRFTESTNVNKERIFIISYNLFSGDIYPTSILQILTLYFHNIFFLWLRSFKYLAKVVRIVNISFTPDVVTGFLETFCP